MTGKTASVSAAAFGKEVLQSREPVLVAFRAAWCVPSQQLAPAIDGLAERYSGRVRVVNIDMTPETEELGRRLGVTRLPVVMLFRDGEAVDFIGGATDEKNITDMIDRNTKPVLEVTELNFDREVLRSRFPVIVNFYAAWCSQSLSLSEPIERLAASSRGRAKVVRVEMGPQTARLCAQYNVQRVPTTLVFQNGEVRDRIFGALTGGTKVDAAGTSCVGLTTLDNLSGMLEGLA